MALSPPPRERPADDGPTDALTDALSELLGELLGTLEAFAWAQRRLHPPWARRLRDSLAPLEAPLSRALAAVREIGWPAGVRDDGERLEAAAEHALEALRQLAAAARDPMPAAGLYRAVRRHLRALEALYPVWPALAPINRFFLEPGVRDDRELLGRLASGAARTASSAQAGAGEEGQRPATGLLHHANRRDERGGFSLYVPEQWDGSARWPLVVTLHGGSGHGADAVWSWLREARSRGFLVLAPTSLDDTWSLFAPHLDGERLDALVDGVAASWNVDRSRILLTGMSDGATFSLCWALRSVSPFTHLAPIAGVLAPLDPRERIAASGRPIYLVHGALDWMFPVATARSAHRELERWGAEVVYREIEDLSHTYPRDENARILEWMDPGLALPPAPPDA